MKITEICENHSLSIESELGNRHTPKGSPGLLSTVLRLLCTETSHLGTQLGVSFEKLIVMGLEW